ncbi:MAG: prolyl aminopeptidase [Methylococcaceae bacterium]|nr:prolyl aminopeptidase [Methylococcaceae bacterium]
MKTLYPEISPYHTFFLATESLHSVYVELSGNAQGIPVIFLHGGPCSGTKPDHRRFFDPVHYHIILMDQRGCGLSTPFGELEHNTTQDLIADMERIRQRLSIQQWVLFGGSWGATLALLYAQQYSEHVSGLIIRGTFLARRKNMDWFLNNGANRIFPEQWQRLALCVPETARDNLLPGLVAALWGEDELAQRRVAKEWSAWGAQVALAQAFEFDATTEAVTEKMLKQVRMEVHYARQQYFIAEDQILANCQLLAKIPTIIIHGRLDLVCPMEAAMCLHTALPHAEYNILPNAGHIAQGEDMLDALVTATDRMRLLINLAMD